MSSALPGHTALKQPVAAAVVICVLCLIAVLGISKLKFDDGLTSFFRGDSAAFARYEENRARFVPSENAQAVLLMSNDFANASSLEKLRDLALELSILDDIDAVYSIFSLSHITQSGNSRPLIPFDLKDDDLSALLEAAHAHPLGQKMLISQDHKSLLMVVQFDFDQLGVEGSRRVLDEVKVLTMEASVGTDITAKITGLAPIRQVLIDGLYGDMLKLNIIGMSLGFLIALFALRSVTLAFLTAVPSNIALMWCLGIIGISGFPIDTVNNVIPVLILVLSLSDSLHLSFELRRQAPQHRKMKDAIRVTLTNIAPACMLTSVTTAIAFVTLMISQSEVIRSFGMLGVVTTLTAVLAVLILHPLVFLAASKRPAVRDLLRSGAIKQSSLFSGRALYELGFRKAGLVAAISLVAIGASGLMHGVNKSNYGFLNLLGQATPEIESLRQIETQLAPTTSIDLPVEIMGGSAFDPDVLDELARVHHALSEVLADHPPFSLVTLRDWLRSEQTKPEDRADLEALFAQFPSSLQRRFLSDDKRTMLLRIQQADHGAAKTLPVLERIETALEGLKLQQIKVLEPTGLMAMSSREGSRMIKRLSISFVFAVLLTGILVAIWFGNWRYGIFAVLPNIFPILMVGAFLYLVGWQLEMSSSIALTIAFGIAVDDTIHMLNHLRRDAPFGRTYDRKTTQKVFAKVAPILVTTTAILSFGTLGTQLSDVAAVTYFGALVIAIFILALLAVLMVLPALWDVWRRQEARADNSKSEQSL